MAMACLGVLYRAAFAALAEAHAEHDGAKTLIGELENGSPEYDSYNAKVKVLSEEINMMSRKKRNAAVFSPRPVRPILIWTRWARRCPRARKC